MSLVQEIFGSAFELYGFLSQKSKSKNAAKRMLIREIRNNIKRLEHRNRNGINRLMLIQKLENASLLAALEQDFSFNKLCPGQKVNPSSLAHFSPAEKYAGWDADRLMNSIDEKIVQLKELSELYTNEGINAINLTLRLNNLYAQLILVSVLIKQAE